MLRMRFAKTDNGVWISHLDLMRLFQRAFKRAGLPLKHSQGFTPRPLVSIALPLSVGVESVCELLDFELEGACAAPEEIEKRLNKTLVPGISVLEVYENGQKLKELSFLRSTVTLEYDAGIPAGCADAVTELFAREQLCMEKKGKNGSREQDIIPMLRSLEVRPTGDGCLALEAVVCAQNPSLNPMLLAGAVERYLPEYTPDFVRCRRDELLDEALSIFR